LIFTTETQRDTEVAQRVEEHSSLPASSVFLSVSVVKTDFACSLLSN
jgi:hypothetical protein